MYSDFDSYEMCEVESDDGHYDGDNDSNATPPPREGSALGSCTTFTSSEAIWDDDQPLSSFAQGDALKFSYSVRFLSKLCMF